jgi:uncharacterized protein YprB with RNaseH-like and TPR domain
MDIINRLRYYQNDNETNSNRNYGQKQKHNDSIAGALNGAEIADGVIQIETVFPLQLQFPHENLPDNFAHIFLPILTRGVFTSQIELNRVILFDLETTGLAGGTGTYPFLQAYGIIQDKNLRIVQYFLSDFGCEPVVFTELKKVIADKNILISYNGKSFDYPLLKNRFILNRFDNLFTDFEHLDLLHLARRVWRNQLDGFSMERIEQKIFLFSRWRDIDGWLIPHAYFEFIRTGNTDDIQRIIAHNQQDLISLLRLLLHLHMVENVRHQQYNTPVELENLCRQAIKKEDVSAVDILLKQCEIRSVELNDSVKTELSLLFKKQKFWDKAVRLWNDLIHSDNHCLFALEELAKYYEHEIGDFDSARQITNRALEYIRLMKDLDRFHINSAVEIKFQKRFERLYRKFV